MTSDQVASLLSAVDAAHGLKVFVVAMLLALTIGRFRRGAAAVQKAPRRK